MGHVSTLDTVLAVLLTLWAVGMWVAVFGLGFLNRGPARSWLYPAITTVILFGVVGQIAHLWEHIAQVIFWVKHPSAPSGMSPWGMALSMGYGQMNKAMPTLGMETLHLVGNFIFLAGLAAAMVLTRRFRGTTARKWATMGVWMQGIHGLEHLSLTL
ncbi:MAG TPA: DUF6008 family protein, partial [Pseudonocardiaceae bacterium]|nr:DUF6008 family protein [Pseudonocardiaceae bacterium]